MLSSAFAIVALVLSAIVGLWKFWRNMVSRKELKQKDAYNELEKGVDSDDTSRITSGFDRRNRS